MILLCLINPLFLLRAIKFFVYFSLVWFLLLLLDCKTKYLRTLIF